MPTSLATLSSTTYSQINVGYNPMVLQSLRDAVKVVISPVKPAADNTVYHLVEARHPPLHLPCVDTNVWAMKVTNTASLIVSELTEVPVIQEEHRNIHDGIGYTYADLISINQAGTPPNYRDILIEVPAGVVPHLREIEVTSVTASSALAEIYEVTAATTGTPLSPHNNNRNFADSPNVTLSIDPTGVTLGNRLEPMLLSGTRQSGLFGERGNNEWDLAPSSLYLLRVTNNTTGAGSDQFVINMFWYEET